MELADKLYKSTEVCDIFGVSLRTLYRYVDSGRLKSTQLPSGRHRFTKAQIEEFLASGVSRPRPVPVAVPTPAPAIVEETPPSPVVVPAAVITELVPPATSVPVVMTPTPALTIAPAVDEAPTDPTEEDLSLAELDEEPQASEAAPEPEALPLSVEINYYHSPFKSLKAMAKIVRNVGQREGKAYALTGKSGLSLYFPIEAFDYLDLYVPDTDLDFWLTKLHLTDSPQEAANVWLRVISDITVLGEPQARGGLNLVPDEVLEEDLIELGEENLLAEFAEFRRRGEE